MAQDLTVGIAGLGAIGLHLARALDAGVQGLRLAAVSARDLKKAQRSVGAFRVPPMVVSNAELAACDVVVEAAPAIAFEEIATAAIEAGRIFVPSSVGALLPRMHLVERAKATGARIIVPTGALLGLDAVRAAAEGDVESVTIETRKPPRGLEGAPYLKQNAIDVLAITTPTRIFKGNAFDAAQGFPANVNVAAALALAGIGPERTMVEIWADPAQTRNQRTIRVEAASARLTMTIENVPSEENPRTGKITPLSILACLRGLTSTLKVGSSGVAPRSRCRARSATPAAGRPAPPPPRSVPPSAAAHPPA
jgi:aspartate dehydrogenase